MTPRTGKRQTVIERDSSIHTGVHRAKVVVSPCTKGIIWNVLVTN